MDQKKKILLVEDDQALAQVYKSRLELEGFLVKHVPNGEEALQVVQQAVPDLILLDIMMPKINGFDVLDILRSYKKTQDVQVIVLTALGQKKDLERARDLGANGYIVKSQVVIGDVVARVKKVLENK